MFDTINKLNDKYSSVIMCRNCNEVLKYESTPQFTHGYLQV